MLGELIQYGAVATKVKAMYARRLMPEDFAKIAALHRVSDVAQYLKEHPGWRGALANFEDPRRTALEATLRRYLLDEYMRILFFIGREDRFIVQDRVLRTEMEQIMLFLRFARAGRAADYRAELPEVFDHHSRIRYDMLSQASNYGDMLEAVKNTRFYSALSRLPLGDGGFPDYTSVEMVMRSHYYRELMKMIDKRYNNKMHDLLKESVGVQVDMINITIIMRVRRFFPEQIDNVLPMLLPVRYKLTPTFVNQLYTAANDAAAEALLRSSPYGKVFSSHHYTHIEEYYYQFLYEFNRKLLSSGTPTVYTPVAYLNLREVELKNLISLIECVRYGVQPSQASGYLFGVPAM